MLISLSEVMTTKDKVVQTQVPLEMENFDFLGTTYGFKEKSLVDLTITNLNDKRVSIEGSTHVSLALFCNRCLKEIEYPMDLTVSKVVDFNLTEEERAEELDETNYIIGYNLDVNILIYDEIIIGFPMKLLCNESCEGICVTCGNNKNEKACDCDNISYDIRMSAIKDIFKNFKEV